MRFSREGIINRSNDKRCLSFSVRCHCLTFKHMERIWICGLYLLTPTMLNTCSFQKYFREQFSEYHSSDGATMISHCKAKWKLLLWGGDLIQNRKKLTSQLIIDILHDTDIFPYNSRTRDYRERNFANTSFEGVGWSMIFFLGTLSFVFMVMLLGTKKICSNTFMKINFKILLWISICIHCTSWKKIK